MTSMIFPFATSTTSLPIARDADLVEKDRLGIVQALIVLDDTTGGNEYGIDVGRASRTELVMLV
jgi:hypothetical protein